jgi:Protein of unknown function (DUF2865)
MIETAIVKPWRSLCAVMLVLVATLAPALAQPLPAPGSPPRNPMCVRLEGQLAALDRGNFDPVRAEQIKRTEDAANKQQVDLDRVTAEARRLGCEGRGFFSLFGGQPPQCGQINNQIQQMRANLDRVLGDLQRLQGNTADREGQRRAILVSLGQNDCGAQYRTFANQGGGSFFERLFGPSTTSAGNTPGAIFEAPQVNNGTYRTLCVRLCDGYYFPISYSATQGKFGDDEKACQRMCPAAETALYTHRNPGEDISQAVSTGGRQYSELPTAFAYRKQYNAACSCKATGQTWADALKHLDDQTVERGDIVVNEERAKLLSLPPEQQKSTRPPARPAAAPQRATPPAAAPAAATAQPAPPTQPADTAADTEPGRRTVRPVGPTFLPAR